MLGMILKNQDHLQTRQKLRHQMGLMLRHWPELKLRKWKRLLSHLKVCLNHRFRVEIRCRLQVGIKCRLRMAMLHHIQVDLCSLMAMLHILQAGIRERLRVMVKYLRRLGRRSLRAMHHRHLPVEENRHRYHLQVKNLHRLRV